MSMRSWWRGLRRAPPVVVDAGLAAVVAVVVMIAIMGSPEPDSRSPDALAYALGALFAGVLVLRRRWPLAVLLASSVTMSAYLAFDYPAFSPALFLGVALYTATAAGHLRWALLVGAVIGLGEVGARLIIEPEPTEAVLPEVVTNISLMIALILLGEAVRSRRAWAAEVQERERRAVVDREREAERRVTEERLRIARELHDVMAHTIAVVTVQAGVASDVIDDHPDQARAALGTIRQAGREAMNELKAVVGVLRDSGAEPGAAPRTPAPGLAQLEGLAGVAGGDGLRVDLRSSGAARPLPTAVDLTAYRIVQESLTNVVRHARASSAAVLVRYEPDALVIEVTDDGRGPNNGAGPTPGPGPGHGLKGMAERAAALGGRFEAGPRPGGGFRVWARLPTGRSRP